MARRTARTAATGLLLALALTGCADVKLPSDAPPPVVEAYSAAGAAPRPALTGAAGDYTPAVPATVEIAGAEPAPVRLADVDAEGVLAVPEDVQELGFWIGSTPMGSPVGTTLIAGHRDAPDGGGVGYFDRLADIAEGETVAVVDGLGVRYEFTVTERIDVSMRTLPPEVFDTDGPRRLVLITCGGPFDVSTGRYRDNIIVWAEPVA
jgi:hypothetical protein